MVEALCRSCDAPLGSDGDRCRRCGAVQSDDEACPSCGALAALREVRAGRYVCAACSAPRKRGPRSVIESDLGQELAKRGRGARTVGFISGVFGALLFGSGVITAGLGVLVFDGWPATLFGVIGGLLTLMGGAGLWLGRRTTQRGNEQAGEAVEAALLEAARRSGGSITAKAGALAARIDGGLADSALTELAKAGRMDLDVDDEGVVHYRVLDPADEDEDLAAQTHKRLRE